MGVASGGEDKPGICRGKSGAVFVFFGGVSGVEHLNAVQQGKVGNGAGIRHIVADSPWVSLKHKPSGRPDKAAVGLKLVVCKLGVVKEKFRRKPVDQYLFSAADMLFNGEEHVKTPLFAVFVADLPIPAVMLNEIRPGHIAVKGCGAPAEVVRDHKPGKTEAYKVVDMLLNGTSPVAGECVAVHFVFEHGICPPVLFSRSNPQGIPQG